MLEVLLKKGLRDTVVVVTRYFGGIKLGAGGLIRAYGRAAAEGVFDAGIVKKSLVRSMTASFDYTWLGKIENELAGTHYMVNDTGYTDRVVMDILVPLGEEEAFAAWAAGLTSGQVEIKAGKTRHVEREV